MAKTAILKVRIISDGSGSGAGFKSATSNLDKFEAKVDKASRVAAVAGGAVLGLAGKAVQAASNLEQAAGAVDSVFQGQAEAVHRLGENASTAVGLSSRAYQESAAVLGAQLQNLGFAGDQLVGTTDGLIALGADLAATFGGTTQEAVNALSAAFRGERDPIERYGVSIKQTQVNAWLAANGMSGLEGAAKSAAEAQATHALILEQTASAQGQFARESDTLAAQQQKASAALEDSSAAIGANLLPVIANLAGHLRGVTAAIGTQPQLWAGIAVAVLGVAGAVLALNGAIKLYRAAMVAVGALKAIWAGLQAAAFAYYYGSTAASSSSAAVQVGTWIGAHARMLALWISQRVAAVGTWIAASAQAVASAAVTAGAWIGAHARMLALWISQRAAAVGTWIAVAAQAAISAAATAGAWIAANARAAASFLITRGAMLAGAAATGVVTAAQWAWNAALSANPIGLVILAVAALVAGFVLLWNKSETFRNAVTAVGDAGVAAFNWIKSGVMTAVGAIQNLWNRTEGLRNVISSAMRAALNPIAAVRSAFDRVASAVSAVIGWISRIRFPRPPSWLRMSASPAFAPATFALAEATTANVSAFSRPMIDAGPVAAGSSGMPAVTVNNTINVNGALDPRAVADQIRGILSDVDRARGSAGAASLRRSVTRV